MIKILVDSSSDLTKEEAEEKGYLFVPIGISLEGKEYEDGVDLTKDEFYDLLVNGETFPKTSQPSPQVFLDLFEQAKKDGDEIVAILLSSALSGTYQSAVLARQMADYEGIHLIDSLTATGVIRVLADYAKGLADQGRSAAEVAALTEVFRSRVHVIAMMDTLEFLQKGGRIGKAAAMLGELARLKPLITLTKEGGVGVIGKTIGKNKAMSAMLKWLRNSPGIPYSPAEQKTADSSRRSLPSTESPRSAVSSWAQPSAPISGLGLLGLCMWRKRRSQ